MVRKGKEKEEKKQEIFAFLFPPFFSSLNKQPKIPDVRRICLLNGKFFLLIYLFIFVFAPFLYLFSFPSSSLHPFILLCTAAMIAHLSVSLSLALCLILFFLLSPLFISFLFPFFSFLFLLVSFLPFFLLQQLPCLLQKQNTCSCYRSIPPASSKKPFQCPFLPLSLLFLPHAVLKSC